MLSRRTGNGKSLPPQTAFLTCRVAVQGGDVRERLAEIAAEGQDLEPVSLGLVGLVERHQLRQFLAQARGAIRRPEVEDNPLALEVGQLGVLGDPLRVGQVPGRGFFAEILACSRPRSL